MSVNRCTPACSQGQWTDAHLHRLKVRPVVEAKGIAELPPGHELIKELARAIAAVAVQVPCHLKRGDHTEVVIRCSPECTRCYAPAW